MFGSPASRLWRELGFHVIGYFYHGIKAGEPSRGCFGAAVCQKDGVFDVLVVVAAETCDG
jgi:hypothetical protein